LRTDIFDAEALAFPDSSKLRPRSLALNWSHENLSNKKPFCDSSHKIVGFQSEVTAYKLDPPKPKV
jgi:hypothetical protein